MTYVATKTLTAPNSAALAVGTFYFRVPYDRDAVDRTLITVPDPRKIGLDGKIAPVDLYPGPWQVRREIRGADASMVVWTKFVVPASPPASSSTPGALSVTVGGSTVLAWDLYVLLGASTVYPPAVVGDAQAARDVAIAKAAEATARAADATAAAVRLDQALAGAPSEYDTFLEIANKIASNDTALGALNSAITAKYSLPGTGIPLSDLKKTDLDGAYAAKAAPLLRSLASHASRPITPYAGALPDVPKTIPGSNPTFTAAGYQLFSDANPKFRIEDAVLTDTGSGTGKNVITGGQDENSYTIATDARVTGSSEYLAIVAFVGSSDGDFNPSMNDQPLTQVVPKWGEAAGMITFQLPLPAGFSRIRIPMGMAQFSNIQWTSGVVLAKPPKRRQAAWLGDSYGAGINLGGTEGYSNAGSVPNRWAQLTGDAVWNLSQGGTGAVYGTGGPNNRSPYGSASRRAALAALPADLAYLVVQASVNDGLALNAGTTTQQAIQDAYAALFAQIATDRPGLPVVVLGVESNTQENGKQDQVNTAAKTAALAAPNVVAYIDQRAAGWVTGTGKVSAPAGDGNRDLVIGTDNIHPSRDYGNDFVARSALRALGA